MQKPERAVGGGAQDRSAPAEDFFPKAQRKRAVLRGTPFGFAVARSAVAAVVPEIGAVYLISCFFQTIKQRDIFERRAAIAQRAFKAVVDVLIFVPLRLIAF